MALEIWPKIGLSGKIRVIASYLLDWYVNKSVQAKDLLPNYKCRKTSIVCSCICRRSFPHLSLAGGRCHYL